MALASSEICRHKNQVQRLHNEFAVGVLNSFFPLFICRWVGDAVWGQGSTG